MDKIKLKHGNSRNKGRINSKVPNVSKRDSKSKEKTRRPKIIEYEVKPSSSKASNDEIVIKLDLQQLKQTKLFGDHRKVIM